MLHSVKQIASNLSEISILRKDKPLFSKEAFLQYAKDHKQKYQMEWHLGELHVSTMFSDDLTKGFEQTLKHPLKPGDKIRVHGWVMLKGLDAGDWKVVRITDDGYFFTKLRGKKEIGFYFHQINGCLAKPDERNNWIEKL